ncbi:Fpg/Nei family DNA glycosylase [Corynebacterium sp. sy017]|uniref:Fpg/Nei family DNA glycosylase n=1 Tax=unclassified Corynebacterium TaxID=2624378 RepID=UPI001185EF44|nr:MULTISPECIES: DNA-formamidopyrimidine glycosylase family protein [unclassified Corynebacterium]MBP3088230.1 Fpg/Nei family DNA glycosylase [Corynebacterium sp. sy017]TSD91561.1 Fpg/Nei family DNA glycosylase [Corynebacterium sp. SY003]
MPEGHVIHKLSHDLNHAFCHSSPLVSSPQGRFAHEAQLLTNHPFVRASAWGKHLFLEFENDSPTHIVHIHLGLIGSFRFEPREHTPGHIRLKIDHPDNRDILSAHLRGPQWCRLISDQEQHIATTKLGIDPLRADTRTEHIAKIREKVMRSQRSIASLLMDQKLFAGVGNIYRAETLFRLRINPFTPGAQLSAFDDIWQDLVFLMNEGVKTGRIDTVRPEHTPQAMNRPPRKDDHGGEVYVYRRQLLPCYICASPIAHTTVEGRNLFWCPTCQNTNS